MVNIGDYLNDDQIRILIGDSVDKVESSSDNSKERNYPKTSGYSPKTSVTGSSVKYKTKNLFTEIFDEQDVRDFMALADATATMENEIISGELKRKMYSMLKEGRQPLQCMVYATKNKEKVFYNNEKKALIWAKAIAEMVNKDKEYAKSINHMLVNWNVWKYQIVLLISACRYIKMNDDLDEVIRDLYTDYEDDKVKYTVIKRLLEGCNFENYKSVFNMLKNADFIRVETDRKYYNILENKVNNTTLEERKIMYTAFRETQGFKGQKKRRIESLFVEKKESDIVKMINEATINQKEMVLKEVRAIIYGKQKDYSDFANQVREIKCFKKEIMDIFMQKMEETNMKLEEIKTCGLAIGDLDSEGKAIPFLKEQMNKYEDDAKKVMFAYVLAVISDKFIGQFVDVLLAYNGKSNLHYYSVNNLKKKGKNQEIRKHLYNNCMGIKDKYGIESSQFKKALHNIGEFFQEKDTVPVYNVDFDRLLFEFLGYNAVDRTIENTKCTARNATLVLEIMEKVMNKNNYEGRYMNFMWDLFSFFINSDIDIAMRIDDAVKQLTGQGIPAM